MKKIAALVVAVLLMMQNFGGIGYLPNANADANKYNILTDVVLTVQDSNGNTVTDAVYEQGASVTLDYEWELPADHSYKSGDTFTFTLPPQFELFNDIPAQPLQIGGESVGTFTVNKASHQVVMTFNDYIDDHDDVHGTVTIHSSSI